MSESSYRWLSPATRNLLILAGLPLIDGFFLAFLATGLWRDPWRATAFGLTAFSGAGCVIAAMRLEGSPVKRFVRVLGVYAVITVGASTISLAQPLFQSLLPPNLHLFTSIFLIGLGLSISGVPCLRRVAFWLGFEAAVKAMIVASLLHGLIAGVTWQFSLDLALLPSLAIAIGAGFSLTTLGMLLGLWLRHAADQRPINWGAGISLSCMGLNLLGLTTPTVVIIAPLALGCLWTLIASVRSALYQAPPLQPHSETG